MSILIDTNILIYAVHTEAAHHLAAKTFVENQRGHEGFFVTWSVLYEWLRITTHPRVFSKPLDPEAAVRFIQELIASPRIDVLTDLPNRILLIY